VPIPAPRLRYLADLPDAAQALASWIMERFEKDGTWPSHSETIIRCYDQRVPQATFTNSSDIFQNDQRGELPAQITLVPWVLYDSGKFREAFNE
jgi:hypothetical protein